MHRPSNPMCKTADNIPVFTDILTCLGMLATLLEVDPLRIKPWYSVQGCALTYCRSSSCLCFHFLGHLHFHFPLMTFCTINVWLGLAWLGRAAVRAVKDLALLSPISDPPTSPNIQKCGAGQREAPPTHFLPITSGLHYTFLAVPPFDMVFAVVRPAYRFCFPNLFSVEFPNFNKVGGGGGCSRQ